MTDRKSTKKVVEHAKKHIKMTMTSSDEIKDEAYVQVLKQIKDHKDPQKAIKGWNFFAIMASCYMPSIKLFYSILNFLLFEIKNNEDQNIKHHANYVFVRLYKTFENKRKNIPSDNEILHIESMKPISLPVHFFSDTSSNADIESYTTMKDLKTLIMKKLQFNVSRIPYYSLYEICQKKNNLEERFLEDNERVCDVLSLWESNIEDYLKKKEQIEFKIYLKIFLYYPYSDTDVDTITAIYSQSVFDVTNGKFNLNEQDIITLAALQLLVQFSTSQDNAYQSLQKKLEKYVPNDKINLNPSVYWVQKIMELYSGLKASSKLEAKLTYIEQLKTSPLWEAHQFVTKVKENLFIIISILLKMLRIQKIFLRIS
jgi:myosin-7